ncbi:cytochrome c [Chitinophaga polysaccharea]|uniref:Cytochrome c n=1 Tax=Chitinophaga polysaccharea TaxID=1293035 RepID=A0A561PR98_9BACT|nr:cytochrome c [Chitinophaga polysaccharea]TWF40639.1 cytochrome c [Chitinophaga polysaccharea]
MNKQIITTLSIAAALLIAACGGSSHESASATTTTASSEQPKSAATDPGSYDPKRGEGKYDASNVTVGTLDASMAAKGKSIAETKCFSCHKTSEEKLVGPGWKGVTSRHPAYWIMNFITNPDPMINKDPEVQAQLEICLVRMPNQNLAEQEARDIVEFMRQNDGAK